MREFINLYKITKTVDTTKLIIGILIIVFFIVKTIIGDAKKEQKATAKKQTPPQYPKTVFPDFFDDDKPQKKSKKRKKATMPPMPTEEGVSVTSHTASQPQMPSEDIDEEQLQAHAERWRQAIIDSEILKKKF